MLILIKLIGIVYGSHSKEIHLFNATLILYNLPVVTFLKLELTKSIRNHIFKLNIMEFI